jgi:hypothetical protein
VLHPLPSGRRTMSHTCWMGAAAHEVVDDRAQGLPRRVSFPAERLRGARSNPSAQHREGSVLSECGRADPSGGGPGSRPGTVSLAHHCVWFGRTPGAQAPRLEVLCQSIEDGVVTTAHVLAGIMAHTPPNCFKSRACSRLRATQNLRKGFICTPAKLLIHRPYLSQPAIYSIMSPNER